MIIADGSSLILLAKINRLRLLKELYRIALIPKSVHSEAILQGKEEGYGDAYMIEKHVGEFIQVRNLSAKNEEEAEKLKAVLGAGEAEALTLAAQEKSRLLTDDWTAKKIAEERKIACTSTPGVLYDALKKRMISVEEYEQTLRHFSKHAWVSPEIITELIQAGYKLRGGKK